MDKWIAKPSLRSKKEKVFKLLENIFSPDIRVKLDKDYRITAFCATSNAGSEWLLKNARFLIDNPNYDDVDFGGICVESEIPEEE